MKNIKIAFFDMDGTLLNEKHSISDKTKETLAKLHAKGMRFAIASGRSLNELFFMMEQYGIKEYIDYYIAYNGYCAYDVQNDALATTYAMKKEWIKEVIDENIDLDINIIDYNIETFNVLKICPTVEILQRSDNTKATVVPKEYFYSKETPKIFMSADPEVLDLVEERFTGNRPYQLFRTGDRYIDYVDCRLSKYVAICKLQEMINIPFEEMIAFGDGGNDVEMLKNLPHSVAMDNALPYVKEVAKYQTLSNKEDGVAYFLEKHFL